MNRNTILDAIKDGGRFIVTYHNTAKMHGRGCPYKRGSVTKTTTIECNVTSKSYGELVSDATGSRNFQASELPWGTWKQGYRNIVIEHNGNLYLRMYKVPNSKAETEYQIEGQPVRKGSTEYSELMDWVDTEIKVPQKQLELGLDKNTAVIPLVLNFDNITSLEKVGANESVRTRRGRRVNEDLDDRFVNIRLTPDEMEEYKEMRRKNRFVELNSDDADENLLRLMKTTSYAIRRIERIIIKECNDEAADIIKEGKELCMRMIKAYTEENNPKHALAEFYRMKNCFDGLYKTYFWECLDLIYKIPFYNMMSDIEDQLKRIAGPISRKSYTESAKPVRKGRRLYEEYEIMDAMSLKEMLIKISNTMDELAGEMMSPGCDSEETGDMRNEIYTDMYSLQKKIKGMIYQIY